MSAGAAYPSSRQWRLAAQVLREHAVKFDKLAEEAEDVSDPWWIPPQHRPKCSVSGEPCTSWTCLVDRCVDERSEDAHSSS